MKFLLAISLLIAMNGCQTSNNYGSESLGSTATDPKSKHLRLAAPTKEILFDQGDDGKYRVTFISDIATADKNTLIGESMDCGIDFEPVSGRLASLMCKGKAPKSGDALLSVAAVRTRDGYDTFVSLITSGSNQDLTISSMQETPVKRICTQTLAPDHLVKITYDYPNLEILQSKPNARFAPVRYELSPVRLNNQDLGPLRFTCGVGPDEVKVWDEYAHIGDKDYYFKMTKK